MLSIGDICQKTGLSARTVRYYEELGLLPGVRRREGGRRVYGADEEERLRFITRLKALGLSLAEIKELLEARQGELDRRIAELGALHDEIVKYRTHVGERVEALRGEEEGR